MTDTPEATPALSVTGSPAAFYLVGKAFTFVPTISNAQGNITCSVSGADLPTGTVLDASTGVISGTPSVVGSTATTLKVTDGTSTVFLPLVLDIVAPVTVTGTAPEAVVGVLYSHTLSIENASGNVSLKSQSADVPAWMTVSASTVGVTLSGTPTTAGSFSFSVTLSDDHGDNLNTISLSVVDPLIMHYPQDAYTLSTGESISVSPTVTGGGATHTFAAVGELPTGITVDADTGALSGTIATAGTYTATVACTSGGETAVDDVTFTIVTAITMTYPPLNGVQGTTVSVSPTITGGSGTRSFALAASSTEQVPSGLTIDPTTGVVSGKPLVSITTTIAITCTDATGSVTSDLAITIVPYITIVGTLKPVQVGAAFSFIPTVTGGDPERYTFNFQTTSGSLPNGINFNTVTGALTGTPTEANTGTEIVISVSDSYQTGKLTVNFVAQYPATLTDGQIVKCVEGKAINYQIAGTNLGTNPIFSISSGSLIAGLSLNPTLGTLYGTPTQVGTAEAQIKVIGAINSDDTVIVMSSSTPVAISGTPDQGTNGIAYKFTPTVSGGAGSYTFTISTGSSLVNGLSFDTTTGTISGTPTTTGMSTVSISVTDGLSTAVLGPLQIVIMAPSSDGTADASDLFVASRLASYVATLTKARVTATDQRTAMRYMSDITEALIKHPTTTSLDAVYACHYKYRLTLFDELSFFNGSEAVNDLEKIGGIYTSYRQLTMSPKIPFSFAFLTRTPVSSAPIAAYFTAKLAWLRSK